MSTAVVSSSAAGLARKRMVCPQHGLLPPGPAGGCGACGKRAYDLDDEDERSILTSLRGVARATRTTRARVVCYPVALLLLVGVLGIGAVAFLLTPVLGEPLARGVERALRRAQPAALSVVDRELLP